MKKLTKFVINDTHIIVTDADLNDIFISYLRAAKTGQLLHVNVLTGKEQQQQ